MLADDPEGICEFVLERVRPDRSYPDLHNSGFSVRGRVVDSSNLMTIGYFHRYVAGRWR
jgi:hypothetical protein